MRWWKRQHGTGYNPIDITKFDSLQKVKTIRKFNLENRSAYIENLTSYFSYSSKSKSPKSKNLYHLALYNALTQSSTVTEYSEFNKHDASLRYYKLINSKNNNVDITF